MLCGGRVQPTHLTHAFDPPARSLLLLLGQLGRRVGQQQLGRLELAVLWTRPQRQVAREVSTHTHTNIKKK